MELADDKPKKKYSVSLLLMLFCIFSFTVGQFIPIYFANADFRALYYFIIFILLVAATGRTIFKSIYKPQKNNISSARLISILVGFLSFVVFGFLTIVFCFAVWTEANVFYIQKDNPKVKIISRYVNEGAFGGGTEATDYQIVLHRPVLFIFNMETSIDTALIDKQKWIKSKD